MSRASWPSWPSRATIRLLTSTPRWSLPIAIFIAVPAPPRRPAADAPAVPPYSALKPLRRQVVEAAPDLSRAVPVDRPLAADRVGDVFPPRREQPRVRPREAAGQGRQVAASHGHQVVGLRRQ